MTDITKTEQKNLTKFINTDFALWMCGISNYANNQ